MKEHQHASAGVLTRHFGSHPRTPARPGAPAAPDVPVWEHLGQSADCIQWIDGEGRLLATNRRGLARLGISATETMGKPWSLVWGAAAVDAFDAAIAHGQGRFQACRKNALGEVSWWDVLVTPMQDARGAIVRLLAIGRDITGARKAEAERGRALARERAARINAERAMRVADEFAKEFSHDLRTPLNAILGWLDLLKQDRSAATLDKALEVIDRNARRQVQIVTALSDMSRMVAGRAPVEQRVVEDTLGIDASPLGADKHGEGPGNPLPQSMPFAAGGSAAELSRPSGEERSADIATLLRDLDVLIVDDESDVLDLLGRVLEDAGAHVLAASTAPEALRLLEEGYLPHFIVSDIGLPGLDGYQFMQRVRSLPGGVASTPAAAVTALARPEDRRRALLSGYQAHLPKPVDSAELIATVASLTGRTGGGPGAAKRT